MQFYIVECVFSAVNPYKTTHNARFSIDDNAHFVVACVVLATTCLQQIVFNYIRTFIYKYFFDERTTPFRTHKFTHINVTPQTPHIVIIIYVKPTQSSHAFHLIAYQAFALSFRGARCHVVVCAQNASSKISF